METARLAEIVGEGLNRFYIKRIEIMGEFSLLDAIGNMKPYLYQANHIQCAGKIIEGLISDHVSSYDEQILTETLFDPLARAVSDEPTANRIYRIRSGQAFWQELTGDPDFYLKIIRLMKDYPVEHKAVYERELCCAINRFSKELLINFASEDGMIDWEKLLEYNSGVAGTKYPA